MTILNHIISGAGRSARAWKWILVSWIITLLLIALVVFPFRSGMHDILGSSMITEKLKNGLDLDVLANSGTGLEIIRSFLVPGILLVMFTGWLLNIFLSGGFFEVLKRKDTSVPSRGFFGASSSNFWSYLAISVVIRIILNSLSFLFIGLPLIIFASSGSSANVLKIIMISGAIYAPVMVIFLLVADYARAWQASSPKKDAVSALGNGFKYTFRYFFSSWIMMFSILAVQAIYTVLVFIFISGQRPDSSSGVFMLFLFTQLLFIVKIYLRTWRFGIITSKFEAHS